MKQNYRQLIMYHQIHQLKKQGLSNSEISRKTQTDRKTVSRYLSMTEEAFEAFRQRQILRSKKLDKYTEFVKGKLAKYPLASAAQIQDWLKENFDDYRSVSDKTVYNFVVWIRNKYNLPREAATRQFEQIEELPYGLQSQVDFGEYNMRTSEGQRKKVWFFAMVLSRSRFKYFTIFDVPVTSQMTIEAHEKAFEYFQGIPQQIVYDQDKVLLVSENKGELILTSTFTAYRKSRKFELHFCRKADPQSKGKVENVIKYIKQNFLINRPFITLDILNEQALAWLERTANNNPHCATRKSPESQWQIEKKHLKAYAKIPFEWNILKSYTVRKDNTISFKSNFYSLPIGSYSGKKTKVFIEEKNNTLFIYNAEKQQIASHAIAHNKKGKLVSNNHHKRDNSKSINALISDTAALFNDQQKAISFFEQIRKQKPRYIRDQLLAIKKAITGKPPEIIGQTLSFCLKNSIYSASDFTAIIADFQNKNKKANSNVDQPIKALPQADANGKLQNMTPQTANIENYQNIVTNNQKTAKT